MEKHTMKDGRDINRTARRKKATITAVQWVLAIIVLIIIVFPIYWMLVTQLPLITIIRWQTRTEMQQQPLRPSSAL